MTVTEKYNLWQSNSFFSKETQNEVKNIYDKKEIEDRFYKDLDFGTGGLRGVIGMGTNRMNIYTVAKATLGFCRYLKQHFVMPSVAIGYDSRINSLLFAQTAAGILGTNNIKVYLYNRLLPTPCLSFAVRKLECSGGIMITASHNLAKYNGYKVYGSDGCQITTKAANDILYEINNLSMTKDITMPCFEHEVQHGCIEYISEDVITQFIEHVKNTSVTKAEIIDKTIKIVYSPLNGTGLEPVTRILKECGYNNVLVVNQQSAPDGNFPTCPNPNPEIRETMQLGIDYAIKNNADLLIATDPDCDRVGIAIKNSDDEFMLLNGNEVGILLLDFICSQRIECKTMPENPVVIKTIVTTDLAFKIAEKYNVQLFDVLTGFKFIGEQIGFLEQKGKENSYIFGFEESYGYLSGSYVRDKDAVNASLLICDMVAYYKNKGMSLYQKLQMIYKEFGYCLNTLHSFEFEGKEGFEKMQIIMANFRKGLKVIGEKNILDIIDYAIGVNDLPKSNVLKFVLEDNCSFVVRPSGTEPKLKIYLSISAKNKFIAYNVEKEISSAIKLNLGL